MSEFKFACPVCGQHITADTRASGSHLECPTCFQKLVVPQAPASADSKLILSATQVGKPRPVPTDPGTRAVGGRPSLAARLTPILVVLVLLALAAGAAVVAYKKQLFKPHPAADTPAQPIVATPSPNPVPTNITWTLNLTNATIPEAVPAGSLHGSGFQCERVVLQGGNLSFRQGKHWPPDLGLTVLLFAQQAEDLSGKTVEVSPDRTPPLPRLILRWKDEQQQGAKEEFLSGYALKLTFGPVANGRIPGQIYVSLPDEQKSFLAGTFAAEIRKPAPPKNPKPKPQPKPLTQK